jgi:hypothetical protein
LKRKRNPGFECRVSQTIFKDFIELLKKKNVHTTGFLLLSENLYKEVEVGRSASSGCPTSSLKDNLLISNSQEVEGGHGANFDCPPPSSSLKEVEQWCLAKLYIKLYNILYKLLTYRGLLGREIERHQGISKPPITTKAKEVCFLWFILLSESLKEVEVGRGANFSLPSSSTKKNTTRCYHQLLLVYF